MRNYSEEHRIRHERARRAGFKNVREYRKARSKFGDFHWRRLTPEDATKLVGILSGKIRMDDDPRERARLRALYDLARKDTP